MTIAQMKELDREYISIREAASVIGCDPQRLRDMLDIDDERPVEQKRFRFPHCKVGNRRRVIRDGFIRWATMQNE